MKKKFVNLVIIFIFIGSAIFPAVNSQFINNSQEKVESNADNDICDLLIITPWNFKRPLQKLVNHKNSFGVRTKLVTLNQIYKEIWYGRDNAEKIKFFIKDAIEESGIKYVLIVGGIRRQFALREYYWLPVRYVHIVDRWGGTLEWGDYYEKEYLSDLYFADIYESNGDFSSWDDDKDGIYGEWNENLSAQDILDLYPDISVGRLPCRNRVEVKIMVNKIINYEKQDNTEKDWFKTMVVAAGDTYREFEGYEGEIETQDALDNMPGFTHVKLWTSEGNLTGWKDVVNTWNQGCGFFYFAGHGSPISWGTFPPDDGPLVNGLKIFHMPFLSNGKKLPICIVGGCHNSMFNVSFLNTPWMGFNPTYESFSWRLTRKIGGGSIATIGNTALGYGWGDKNDPNLGGGGGNLSAYFFEAIGINGIDILGKAIDYALSSYLDEFPIKWDENSFNDTTIDAKTVTNWFLMGDPSLKIGGYAQVENKNI